MVKVEGMHTALEFLRAIHGALKKTTIDCDISSLSDENLLSNGLCSLDNIKRNNKLSSDASYIFNMALMCSEHDVSHDDLHKDLVFLFQFISEVRQIIGRVTNPCDDSISVKEIKEGLNDLANSISFGNPLLPDGSGAGIVLSLMDLLLHREKYHAIYKGFTNSTPLAKLYIVINTLDRRTTCTIIAK